MKLPLQRSVRGARLLFFLSLCMLFVWLGTGSLYWKRMAAPVVLGILCFLLTERRVSVRDVPGVVWLPLLLAGYTALSPGNWGQDGMLGLEIALAYLAGLSAVLVARADYWKAMTCLPLVLVVALAGYCTGLSSRPLVMDDARLVLFLKYPNILSSVASCAVVFLVTFRHHFRAWLRPLWIVLLAGCLAALLMTASRSAYLGLLVCAAFWMVVLLRRHCTRVLGACLVLAVCVPFVLPADQLTRLESAVCSPLTDRTFQTRLPIWEVTVAGIEEAPWLGHSISAFRAYHGAYLAQHGELLAQKYPEVEPVVYHPHNLVLSLLFMYGVAGTVLFAGAFVPAIGRAMREKDIFFLSIVLFYGVYGLLEFSLDRKDGIVLLFFPLGLVYGRAVLEGKMPAQHH